MTQFGGVVLCGGKSSRMGQPKHLLPFGSEVMLQRTTRLVEMAVSPVVVVAARNQELPPLAPTVEILRDDREDFGPLAGMIVGLCRLEEIGLAAAYVTACDTPLLRPEFVERLCSHLGEADIAIPQDIGFGHPLSAVYRTSLWRQAAQLIQEDQRRVKALQGQARVVHVELDELRAVDPKLHSLQNLNTPEEYETARREMGY